MQCSGSKQEASAFPFAFHVGHKHLRQRGWGVAVGGLVRQISLPGGNSHTSQADSKFSHSSVSETKSCLEFNTFGSCPRPSVVEAHLALAAQLEHSVKCRKKDYTELFAQDIHNLGPLEGNTDSFIPRNLVANVWLIKCHQLVPSEGNWVRICALQCFPVCPSTKWIQNVTNARVFLFSLHQNSCDSLVVVQNYVRMLQEIKPTWCVVDASRF